MINYCILLRNTDLLQVTNTTVSNMFDHTFIFNIWLALSSFLYKSQNVTLLIKKRILYRHMNRVVALRCKDRGCSNKQTIT